MFTYDEEFMEYDEELIPNSNFKKLQENETKKKKKINSKKRWKEISKEIKRLKKEDYSRFNRDGF